MVLLNISPEAKNYGVFLLAFFLFGLSRAAFSQEPVPPVGNPPPQNDVSVLPEVATPVEMSASDANRIVCGATIEDVIFSKEKGIAVHYTKKDAFLKFQIVKEGGEMIYATTPAELFVVCGEHVFRIIAIPKRVPSKTVRLMAGSADQIKSNLSLMKGMPYEEKLLTLIRAVYTDQIPESFTVTPARKMIDLFRDIEVTLTRTISVEGEGLQVKEYLVQPRGSRVELHEKDFLKVELAVRPVAITVDRLTLTSGQTARVLIVEQRGEEN